MRARKHTALAPGAEFDQVRAIWDRLGRRAIDSGDDCAIVPVGPMSLAVSSDLSIEGTHFCPGWITPFEIGFRAATAALSDLAAVAATPLGVQAAIGASSELHDDVVPDLMAGVGEAAARVGARVWGGDLVRSDPTVVDVTVIGRIDGEPLRRRGAEPLDQLFVTGTLGGPASALRSWLRGSEPDAWARQRFAQPAARTVEAQWLQGHGARAMIDVSDGLLADVRHLAAASGVGCDLHVPGVPCGTGVTPLDAVASGEEYELLVAFPRELSPSLSIDFARTFDIPLTWIGECREGAPDVHLLGPDGPIDPPPVFRHF